ncbi:MAG: hypothetical protein AAF645_01510 [Myxococcota bacterium]
MQPSRPLTDPANSRARRAIWLAALALLLGCGDDAARETDLGTDADGSIAIDGGGSCGNGMLDEDEVCDGDELGGASCTTLRAGVGTLGCSTDCTDFDVSACEIPENCGNGMLDGGEVCDGTIVPSTCIDEGFADGPIACSPDCLSFDTDLCPCLPATCDSLGAECGAIEDGCGATLDCGDDCGDPWLSCGGAGVDNACGALCAQSCPSGSECTERGVCTFTGDVDLDVDTLSVTVRVLFNGEPAEDNVDCSNPDRRIGTFGLSGFSGPSAVSGPLLCGRGATAGPFVLQPGTYTATVRGQSASATNLPLALFRTTVEIDGPEAIIDVVTVPITGRIESEGATPSDVPEPEPGEDPIDCVGSVGTLIFDAGGDSRDDWSITVPCDAEYAFEGRLFPGTYAEVRLEVPRNRGLPEGTYVLARDFEVSGAADLLFDTRIPEARVSGRVRIDDAPPTPTDLCSPGREGARVIFLSDAVNFDARLDCDGDFTFERTIAPGTYTLVVQTRLSFVEERVNFRGFPELTVADGDSVELDLNVELVTVSGQVRVAGAVPEGECDTNAGTVIGPGSSPIRCPDYRFGPITFPRGMARFTVRPLQGGPLPEQTAGQNFFVDMDIDADTDDLILDMPNLANVSLGFTLNGASPVEIECNDNPDGAAAAAVYSGLPSPNVTSLAIPCGADFETTASVFPGTYAFGVRSSPRSNLPPVVGETIAITGEASVTVDIRTRTVSGQVRVGGALPTEGECEAGDLLAAVEFINVRPVFGSLPLDPIAHEIRCGDGFDYRVELPLGVYEVRLVPADEDRDGVPDFTNLPAGRFLELFERFEVR